MIYVYIYLMIGLLWGVATLKDTVNELENKYPQMHYIGANKKQKFVYFIVKTNMLGFATIIHLFVMSFLWLFDMGFQLHKKLKKGVR